MKHLLPWLWLGLALFPFQAAGQLLVNCNYSVSPILDFGAASGLPTSQIDVTASIQVTCTMVSVGLGTHRVCLSIPEGTGGVSIADRQMVADGHFVQYQLYSNPARTNIWGAMGASSPPVALDFSGLTIGIPSTQTATIYARVFAGQSGKAVGTYQSNLTPIVARRQNYLTSAPSCHNVTANAATLPVLPAQFTLETDCSVSANPLDFGTVTAMSGHAATTNLSVTCTLDGPYSIALDGGSVSGDVTDRRMQLGPGPEMIEYQLYQDAGHTQVWGDTPGMMVQGTGTGAPQSVSVFGLVPAQGPKQPGAYQDTITVTVTF